MIIAMRSDATNEQIQAVDDRLRTLTLVSNISRGAERTLIGASGDYCKIPPKMFETLPGVERVITILKPYKIVSRESHEQDSVITIGNVKLGGNAIQVISGPCSVETPEQMAASAAAVSDAGCQLMRGGAFKPRSSPYTFQGLGEKGLEYLVAAARKHSLAVVTELMDVRQLDTFLKYDVDVIQIGTRNMQNFDLLKEVGRVDKPVILKRGMAATVSEWLMSAEYIAAAGNHKIIFCERGVRSFETAYRNMLDVTAIPVLKRETHLPVIIDPSHAGGKAWMVPALARAAVAAGADGLLVEMHPQPSEAWCDADQALSPQELNALMEQLRGIARVLGRNL